MTATIIPLPNHAIDGPLARQRFFRVPELDLNDRANWVPYGDAVDRMGAEEQRRHYEETRLEGESFDDWFDSLLRRPSRSGRSNKERETMHETATATAPASTPASPSPPAPATPAPATTPATTPPAPAPAPSSGGPANIWGNDPLGSPVKIPVFGVSGEKGAGKTFVVLSIDPPSRRGLPPTTVTTLMFDLELSSATYSFGHVERRDLYGEIAARTGNKAASAYDAWCWFRDAMLAVPAGKYTVIAVDPISDIESGLVEYVERHPQEFGLTAKQISEASGLKWGAVNAYLKRFLGVIASKCETFAFTVHMGNVWKGGRPVDGKRKAKGKSVLAELASLYVLLRRSRDAKGIVPKIPSAVTTGLDDFKSRLLIHSFDGDGELVAQPILPPNVPEFTPAAIRKYIAAGGVDYAKLKKGERVVEVDSLSDDDKLILHAEIAENERVAAEERSKRDEVAAENRRKIEAAKQQQQRAASTATVHAHAEPTTPYVAPTTPTNDVAVAVAAPPVIPATPASPPAPAPPEKPAPTPTQSAAATPSTSAPDHPPVVPLEPYSAEAVFAAILHLANELGMTDEQLAGACRKRGADTVTGLTEDARRELHRALQTAHDKRVMGAALSGGGTPPSPSRATHTTTENPSPN